MPPLAQIVVTPREGFQRSLESLASILAHTPPPLDLVYVDAGSPPAVRVALEHHAATTAGLHVIRVDHTLSPNEAKHLALPHLRHRHVAFVENDVLVGPGWLEALCECADDTGAAVVAPLYLERLGDAAPRVHMLGGQCRILERHGRRRLVVTHSHRQGGLPASLERQRTEHVEMHGFLLQRAGLGDGRVFDPEIPSLPENADFCLQVLHAGGTLWIEPRARLTVLLPDSIPVEDRDFFRLRWSEEWIERGFARFRAKWNLSGRQPVLESQRRWARAHRMVSYVDSLHQRLRVPADSILNRRVLTPLERRWRER